MEMGQFSRAAEALNSEGIDYDSREAKAAMYEKHPQAPPPSIPADAPSTPSIRFAPNQVVGGIQSFRSGSAPGPSGFRPEHLKAVISTKVPSRRQKAIAAITAFINHIVDGRLPAACAPFFFGARLFAAKKKNGGHRPIAVGNIHRRLASKCAAFAVAERAANLFKPNQLGVGVRGGCEAIIHALQSLAFDESVPDDSKLILQIDLDNAFNRVDRTKGFEEVRRHFPDLSRWVESSYGSQPELLHGDDVILSCLGWQQGDPLGSFLLAISANPIIKKIGEIDGIIANSWYLDDGNIIGPRDSLKRALEILVDEGALRGLHLSAPKSSVWRRDMPATEDATFLGVLPESNDGFKILGAAVGNQAFVSDLLKKRINKIAQLVSSLPNLQDAHRELDPVLRSQKCHSHSVPPTHRPKSSLSSSSTI